MGRRPPGDTKCRPRLEKCGRSVWGMMYTWQMLHEEEEEEEGGRSFEICEWVSPRRIHTRFERMFHPIRKNVSNCFE